MTMFEGEIDEKAKAVLSSLLHPGQALDLDNAGMKAVLTLGAGLEKPARESLVQC